MFDVTIFLDISSVFSKVGSISLKYYTKKSHSSVKINSEITFSWTWNSFTIQMKITKFLVLNKYYFQKIALNCISKAKEMRSLISIQNFITSINQFQF